MVKMGEESTDIDPRLVKIGLVLMLGITAPALDATIVNVAINTIAAEMHTDISIAQWLTTSYMLALGIAVPLSAWFVNRFSAKNVYLLSIAAFFVGSLGAVCSWNMQSLILSRVFQGMGAGILMPIMQTILIRYSGGQNLGKLMALISIPVAIIPILGPTVGGVIVNYLPWRWIFAINIPLCILAFFFSITMLPHTEAIDKEQRLDIIGLILLAAAFCTLIFGISELSDADLNTAIIKIALGIIFWLSIAYM
jgi:EmrB/QacA subfamily drug resistance transporter